MTADEWIVANGYSHHDDVVMDMIRTAWNAAKDDDARICNTYGKETKGNMHKSLAAFECAKLIKRSMK